MSRTLLGFVAIIGFALTLNSLSPAAARAGIADYEDATKEIVVGDENAPVTLIEYASLGCPHCKSFHQEIYPQVKKDYIDTGKLKLIYRDFPLGRPALAAHMIARCSGSARYLGMVDLFFRSQAEWGDRNNPDPFGSLKKVARFGGLSSDDVDECFKSQEILDFLQETARHGAEELGVDATPYLIINGENVKSPRTYEEFKAHIDAALN